MHDDQLIGLIKIATPFILFGLSAVLTSIWYRLGAVKKIETSVASLDEKFDNFKTEAYKTFVTEKTCDLKRQICGNGATNADAGSG